MKVSQLVLAAAKAALAEDAGLLGVRLSPAALSIDDINELRKSAAKVLGAGLHLVASAPGLTFERDGNVCLAPDERAAEQATSWRNAVDVKKGERLLYVSVAEHPKASGLKDCLVRLTDAHLRSAFERLGAETANGLPAGLVDAMRDAGVLDSVPTSSLCDYAAAVAKDKKRDPWAAAGEHLPTLGLARDSRLKKNEAAERLAAQAEVIRRVATSERRRAEFSGPLHAVAVRFREALTSGAADPERVFRTIDVGELTTAALTPKTKPQKKKTAVVRRDKKPVAKKGSAKKTARDDERDEEDDADDDIAFPADESGTVQMTSGDDSGKANTRRRVLLADVEPGLEAILTELHRGPEPLSLRVAQDPRAVITAVPQTQEIERLAPPASVTELPSYDLWRNSRSAFLDGVRAHVGDRVASALVAGALGLFADDIVRGQAEEHLESCRHLLREARANADPTGQQHVLCLDTALITDSHGPALRMIGPLHPLVLSQSLARARALKDAGQLAEHAKRLVHATFREAPVSPAEWPDAAGGSLTLAPPSSGVLLFEREPEAVSGPALKAAGAQLLERYLALYPHASFGLRVAVFGRPAAPLIEGLAARAAEEPLLDSLEVFYGDALEFGARSTVPDAIAEGWLRLSGLPLSAHDFQKRARPHLIIRLTTPASRPQDEEPAAMSGPTRSPGAGILKTTFEVRETSLRATTSVDGVPALEAFEALIAEVTGRVARRAFTLESAALSLQAALPVGDAPPVTWHVAIGDRFGKRPPVTTHLLVHERIGDGASCVVVTGDARPVSRSVGEALKRVGVNEERPTPLRMLASKLANASGGGLVSLNRSGEHLVAAGVLALELQRRGALIVARVDDAQYAALIGEVNDDSTEALLLGVGLRGHDLVLQAGYATLSPDVEVSVGRGQLQGAPGRRLSRLVDSIRLAAELGLAASAAREALSWLMWPALAASELRSAGLAEALARFSDAGAAAVEAVCLVPPALAQARGKALKIGTAPANLAALDLDLFNRLILVA